MPVFVLLLLAACELPACRALCEERAACIADAVAANDATWEDWTGEPSEAAWVDACFAEFRDAAVVGDDVNALCADERTYACDE